MNQYVQKSMRRRNRRAAARHFSLLELLTAMGLLIVIAMVVLQLFMAADSFWKYSENQGALYGDAQAALNLVSGDLENIVLNNSADDASGVAPLWVEGYDLNEIPFPQGYTSYSGQYATALHFITRTRVGLAEDTVTDLSEMTYLFLPPREDDQDWTTGWPPTGVLLRQCVDGRDANSDGSPDNNEYDFLEHPVTAGGTRVADIFNNLNTAYVQVIDGVLDFQVRVLNDSNDAYKLMTRGGVGVGIVSGELNQDALLGVPEARYIQLILTLLPADKQRELAAIDASNADGVAKRLDYVHRNARTFTKTISLN